MKVKVLITEVKFYLLLILIMQNPDNLLKSIPEYLREDTANEPYDLFV